MSEEQSPPFTPRLHEVLQDLGHMEDGQPREGVHVGPGWSGKTIELRHLGDNGGVWDTPLNMIQPLDRREVAPPAVGRVVGVNPVGVLALASLELGTVVAGGFAMVESSTWNPWRTDARPECCGQVEWTGDRPFGRRAADDSWWSCPDCGDYGFVEDGLPVVIGRLSPFVQAVKAARPRGRDDRHPDGAAPTGPNGGHHDARPAPIPVGQVRALRRGLEHGCPGAPLRPGGQGDGEYPGLRRPPRRAGPARSPAVHAGGSGATREGLVVTEPERPERASNDLDAEFALLLAASGDSEGFIRSGRRELQAELDHQGQGLRCRPAEFGSRRQQDPPLVPPPTD
ncbi:hypothetical protein ACFVXG_37680 [Kitasatospora sp. NPDC058162]|uniref:hypothetical protein n=1 Tax=Kitasatospora sp. NPDC058162 TaxID=3346362 RepID=UPI0036DB1AD4